MINWKKPIRLVEDKSPARLVAVVNGHQKTHVVAIRAKDGYEWVLVVTKSGRSCNYSRLVWVENV